MVDWNLQSGRELFVVFAAAQGDGGESGIIHRLWAGGEAGQPSQAPRTSWHRLPRRCRRLSLCLKSQGSKETRLSFNPSSPVLGLWHSNKDWLISQPLGTWKIRNVVVQGCVFRFWLLWLVNRLGMCDKTWTKSFRVAERSLWLYDWSEKVTFQAKTIEIVSSTACNITIFKVYFE